MKTLLIGLFLIPAIANAQLQGVGSLKIGVATSSIVLDISKESKVEIENSSTALDTYKYASREETNQILKILPKQKPRDIEHLRYSVHPQVAVYYINRYNVAGVPLKDLYLYFYNDTLYMLECKGDVELLKAMQIKYGKGESKVEEKSVKCISRLAGEFTLKENTTTVEWESELKNIQAVYSLRKYYDSKCVEQFASSFSVSDFNKVIKVFDEEMKIKEKAEKVASEEKKEQLKNF